MQLWILQPLDSNSGPWYPYYDKAFGMVVRAATEADARRIADENAGDEVRAGQMEQVEIWTNPELVSCVPLANEGEAGLILRDFSAG